MKIKTSELVGLALNWAVDKARGKSDEPYMPRYSSDWAEAGPIIEREKIDLYRICASDTEWQAGIHCSDPNKEHRHQVIEQGSTPLIAAMRCFVASKLGDEIEAPDDLLEA